RTFVEQIGRHPLRPALLPYTTLFRSLHRDDPQAARDLLLKYIQQIGGMVKYNETLTQFWLRAVGLHTEDTVDDLMKTPLADVNRSEEHTSELQSQSNHVCRLLLQEKK